VCPESHRRKEELFNELLESVREGGEILCGKKSASRTFNVEKPDAEKIRGSYNMTQIDFATMMGVSVDTLQNREQGSRSPQGPARVLLHIAAKHPDVVWDVVKPPKRSVRQKA
jgi:putative transcriptional regulator